MKSKKKGWLKMSIGRREFLKGASVMAFSSVSSGCIADCLMPKAPDLRFGAISDVHLKIPGDEKELIKAFTYFNSMRVDAVMISGDIADMGLISELRRLAEAWEKVFPGNKGADGRHVEKLFIYGNHDFWGSYNLIKNKDPRAEKDAISYTESRPAEVWEEIFKEPYSDFWIKDVKGYTFIGGHWTKSDQFDGLADFLKLHKDRIDPSKPFFYTQHSHPKDTCMGPWAWGRDNGASTEALSKYPNAVAISGHSHYSLTDERSVWQGAFTSINASSLRYISTLYALRENAQINTHGFCGDKRKRLTERIRAYDSAHGMLISVYGNELVIERRDFYNDEKLAQNWVITVPPEKDQSFEARAKRSKPPQFAADAQVKIERLGKDKIQIEFPSACSVGSRRAFEYEITATLVEDDVDLVQLQRRIIAKNFHKKEKTLTKDSPCVISLSEIPIKGNMVFSVRPVDCFGNKGSPIFSRIKLDS
jgi:predicted phosphodiesterase